MIDTPDLHTLAAEAFAAFTLGFDQANPWAAPNDRAFAAMDAVLAAVLPAHRRMVQRETIQAIIDRADRFSLTLDGLTAAEWLPRLGIELPDPTSAAPAIPEQENP